MSPEQARGKPVDQRADIWAFGVVLYEMLTGRAAFAGETVTDVLAAVVTKDLDLTTLPEHVGRLLAACLEKDPRKRLRSIGDAWRLLEDQRPVDPATAQSRSGVRTAIATTVLSLAAAGVVSYLHFTERPPAADPIRLQLTVPAEARPDAAFSISPDGRRLVFLGSDSDGRTQLWLRALDEDEARPLPGTEQVGSGSVFWSPDGRWLAFANQGRLKKLDIVNGGAPQVIADVSGSGVIGGSWSRDDVLVFGSNIGTRPGSGGMFRVSASGGTIAPVTTLDASRQEDGHRHPYFLPDGRHFLYLRRSSDPRLTALFLGDVEAAPASQPMDPVLTTTAAPAFFVPSSPTGTSGHLVYVRDGAARSLAFDSSTLRTSGQEQTIVEPVGTFLDRALLSVTATGTLIYTTASPVQERQLTWFDSAGKATGTVETPAEFDQVKLSPDGGRAAVERSERGRGVDRNLWVVDFARGRSTRVTFPPVRGIGPIWSSDGSRLVFGSGEGQRRSRALYRKAASGAGDVEVLLNSTDFVGPDSVSRDGRFLLYTATAASTGEDLWALPLDGTSKPFPILQTPLQERNAQISPDARWVAYEAVDRTGRSSVYVRPFSPSPGAQPSEATKWLISSNGGTRPQWLSNGRRLSYATADADGESRLMVVDVAAGETFEWDKERPLMPIPSGAQFFDLTEDGTRLLAGIPDEGTIPRPPLNVILNFPALLAR
jgi:Tol biopolymer transport system component